MQLGAVESEAQGLELRGSGFKDTVDDRNPALPKKGPYTMGSIWTIFLILGNAGFRDHQPYDVRLEAQDS